MMTPIRASDSQEGLGLQGKSEFHVAVIPDVFHSNLSRLRELREDFFGARAKGLAIVF